MKAFRRPTVFTLFAAFFLLIVASSCEDDAAPSEPTAPQLQILGRWEFVKRTGGLAGQTEDADPANKQELEFRNDGTALVYQNGNLMGPRHYSVERGKSHILQQTADILLFSSPYAKYLPLIIAVDDHSLTLTQDVEDGYTEHYKR